MSKKRYLENEGVWGRGCVCEREHIVPTPVHRTREINVKIGKLMKHSKRYKRTGTGVELLCGNEVIACNSHRGTNFYIDGCPICGDFVQTLGESPDTDRVIELGLIRSGNKVSTTSYL